MSYDPFVILGVSRDASQQEILDAYKAKRSELSEQLFQEGEAGAEAARQIRILDEAYQSAMEIKETENVVENDETSVFVNVTNLIKSGDLEGAQSLLDQLSYRGAEWHYHQARIYYAKKWYDEAKSQLDVAIEMDPSNAKYKRVLDRINERANTESRATEQRSYTNVERESQRTYGRQQRGDDAGSSICSICAALWCADTCCECMGGDLIACC